jgi:hypothetical protein
MERVQVSVHFFDGRKDSSFETSTVLFSLPEIHQKTTFGARQ